MNPVEYLVLTAGVPDGRHSGDALLSLQASPREALRVGLDDLGRRVLSSTGGGGGVVAVPAWRPNLPFADTPAATAHQ
jgi:hypothetical protein